MFGGGLPFSDIPQIEKREKGIRRTEGVGRGEHSKATPKGTRVPNQKPEEVSITEKPEPGGAGFWPSSSLTSRPPLCFLIGKTVTITSAWERPDQRHCAQPSGSFWHLVFARTVSLWSRGGTLPTTPAPNRDPSTEPQASAQQPCCSLTQKAE